MKIIEEEKGKEKQIGIRGQTQPVLRKETIILQR